MMTMDHPAGPGVAGALLASGATPAGRGVSGADTGIANGGERTSPFRPRDFRIQSVIAKAEPAGSPTSSQSVQRTLLNSILRRNSRTRYDTGVSPRPASPVSPECSSCQGRTSECESETSHSHPQIPQVSQVVQTSELSDTRYWSPYTQGDVISSRTALMFPFVPGGRWSSTPEGFQPHQQHRVPSPSPTTSLTSSPEELDSERRLTMFCEPRDSSPRLQVVVPKVLGLGLPWASLSSLSSGMHPSLPPGICPLPFGAAPVAQSTPFSYSSSLKFGVDRILSEDVSSSAVSARRHFPRGDFHPSPEAALGLPLGGLRGMSLSAHHSLGPLPYTTLLAPTPLRAYPRVPDGLSQAVPGVPGVSKQGTGAAVPGASGSIPGMGGVTIGPGPGKRKRSWSRAVFSNLQRKGLEKRFQLQKYITKPDRRQLAATLGLTDAQVKVWFQNRRMKWRHTKETKNQQTRHSIVNAKTEESLELRRPDSTQDRHSVL